MKNSKEYLDSIYEKHEVCKLKIRQKKSRRRIMIASVAGIMCLVLAFVFVVQPMLSGKDKYVVHAADLMEDIDSEKTAEKDGRDADEVFAKAYADFAMELFGRTVDEKENVMVSPLSVYIALAMTANGADGETLSQMEEVFGMDTESLNAYMLAYVKSLSSVSGGKFNIANSIWFRNDGSLKVNDEFLQTNADYYKADAFAAEFDEKTLADINSWVALKTDNMINSLIDSIDADSMMCLINTVLFDAEWEVPYDASRNIEKKAFENAEEEFETVDFLNSTEYIYLECDDAVGVIKPYKNEQYSFVALLPDSDVNINDFVKTLTGDKWLDLIENKEYTNVITSIPKFEHDYSTDMKDILIAMGMKNAFDGNVADFSGIGFSEKGPLYIGSVIHKAYISVAELGTKAGAASAVIMLAGGARPEHKTVELNRPFVYAIMDNNTNLPIFIGTVMDIAEEDTTVASNENTDEKAVVEEIEEEPPVELCEGILKYTVDKNGEATITGVTDKSIDFIEIPERIGATETEDGYVVTRIGYYAFQFCENLTEAVLPDTVVEIKALAFCCCTGLKSLVIPKSVSRIGGFAFANCDGLTEITIPDGVTEMEYRVFYDSNNLEKVVLPDSITVIEEGAFERCYKLSEVNVPKQLTYIGWAAFESCERITKLEMPKTVITIEPDAFKYCSNLEEVVLPDTVEYIGPTSFWEDTKLTIITPAGSYAEGYANRKSISVKNQ